MRAIRVLGVVGALGAVGQKCLISETISEPMSWLRLKADFFSDFIAKSSDALTQRLCHTLTSFMNDSEKVASH